MQESWLHEIAFSKKWQCWISRADSSLSSSSSAIWIFAFFWILQPLLKNWYLWGFPDQPREAHKSRALNSRASRQAEWEMNWERWRERKKKRRATISSLNRSAENWREGLYCYKRTIKVILVSYRTIKVIFLIISLTFKKKIFFFLL